MNEQISNQALCSLNPEGCKIIMQAVESFFNETSIEVVDYLETVLYDWYMHAARDIYKSDRINEYVNIMFKVNDLLLKLNHGIHVIGENKELA